MTMTPAEREAAWRARDANARLVVLQYALGYMSEREMSLAIERETGADSIPTVERAYPRSDSGAFLCVWPGCSFARHDASAMWRHCHNQRAHPWPAKTQRVP